MKRIFPEFKTWSNICGAMLACLIMATPVAGIQTGDSAGSTDPYFQKPSTAGVVLDDTRVAIRQTVNNEQDWAPGNGRYTLAKQPTSSNNAIPNSIIRSTQDWNENQVIRNESFVPGDSVAVSSAASGPQELALPGTHKLTPAKSSTVQPPWRRSSLSQDSKAKLPAQEPSPIIQNDFSSTTPPTADTTSPVQPASPATTDLDAASRPSRQSPFQPAAGSEQPTPEKSRQPLKPLDSQGLEIPNSFSEEPPTLRQVTGDDSKSVKPGSDVTAIAPFESSLDSKDAAGKKSDTFAGDSFVPLGSTADPAREEPQPETKSFSANLGEDTESAETENPETKGDSGTTRSFEPGRVLALVGGEPIFMADLLFDVNNFIKRVAPDAPESVVNQQRPLLIKKMLPRFIDAKLLYVGTMRGLPEQLDVEKVLEQAGKEFDEKAMERMMEQSGTTTTAEFDAHLRLMGSSLRKMRRTWAKEQLVRFFLSKQLNVDMEVTHQEMLDYYRKHEADYLIEARAKWEQIMVRFDKFSSREEARQAIVALGDKIVYGAKLDAVARESSHGFLASKGGQHDWTTQDALVLKELDKAIFDLPIGTLSDIIETRDGFHIIRVIDREEKTKKSFLDAQVDIKQVLQDQKREEAFQEHLKKLKREIPVEIFDISEDEAQFGETYSLGN